MPIEGKRGNVDRSAGGETPPVAPEVRAAIEEAVAAATVPADILAALSKDPALSVANPVASMADLPEIPEPSPSGWELVRTDNLQGLSELEITGLDLAADGEYLFELYGPATGAYVPQIDVNASTAFNGLGTRVSGSQYATDALGTFRPANIYAFGNRCYWTGRMFMLGGKPVAEDESFAENGSSDYWGKHMGEWSTHANITSMLLKTVGSGTVTWGVGAVFNLYKRARS